MTDDEYETRLHETAVAAIADLTPEDRTQRQARIDSGEVHAGVTAHPVAGAVVLMWAGEPLAAAPLHTDRLSGLGPAVTEFFDLLRQITPEGRRALAHSYRASSTRILDADTDDPAAQEWTARVTALVAAVIDASADEDDMRAGPS